jgi:hypothetical protein
MKKTQIKQLIYFLEDMASEENDMKSLLAIKTITLQVYSMLLDERKQIEAAYNSGKLNSIGDGNMYYFMNYITND